MIRDKEIATLIEFICKVIQDTRLKRGYSIYELSQRSGVSQQAIGYYEKGKRRPTLECLIKIAQGLDLTASEIIAKAESILVQRRGEN